MKTREELHQQLLEVTGVKNIYFQPPTNTQIKYPCIVYKFDGFHNKNADDKKFATWGRYTITHIYQKYSQNLRDKLPNSFDFIDLSNTFTNDGLYHDVYTLYY